jgi:CRP-like cAMP-binding protein
MDPLRAARPLRPGASPPGVAYSRNEHADRLTVTISMRVVTELSPLDRLGWLAEQPAHLQSWFAAHGRWRQLAAGESIYDAGDEADALFGLGSGALDITLPLTDHEPVVMHRGEVGFWIGDLALLAGTERLVSVHARRAARVYVVPGRAVRALLEAEPEHWPRFYALTHRNMRTALHLLAEALSMSPSERICRRLLQLVEPDGTVRATQEELADLLGVTRATVRRVLKRLVAEGAIATGYGRLRVCDRCRLERLAELPS